MAKLEFIDLRVKGSNTFFGGVENTETKERYGVIKWSVALKEYVYNPFSQSYFTVGLLQEVVDFINKLNKESSADH